MKSEDHDLSNQKDGGRYPVMPLSIQKQMKGQQQEYGKYEMMNVIQLMK